MRETSAPDPNVASLCPAPGDLLCASTNELPSDEQQAVSRHITHCPRCQEELRASQELSVLLAADASYLFETERTAAPSTPSPARTASVARWLSLAAALILIVGMFGGFLRGPDVAQADQILARLAEHQRRAARLEPWYVWTVDVPSRGHIARATVNARALDARTDAAATVEALLQPHGFALGDPFRVAALQAWSARLAQRRDRVAYRDGEIVLTISGRDALREIEVAIDPATFVIVSQRWTFPGVGQLECRRPEPRDASTKTEGRPEPGRRR